MTEAIPTYVYRDKHSENSLLQGDILKVDGRFRDYFKEFYPAIDYSDDKNDKYVMVLTQSCDLVKTEKRRPKLSHINVCLVRNLKSVIQRVIDEEIKPVSIGGKNLLQRAALDQLKDRLSKLLNNSDQKTNFFLPKKMPFQEDMVALLPLSFSFRIHHYDLLLENRVLGLKPEFQAKVGHIISQLYGRIGTMDLYDAGWGDKETRTFINNFLKESKLEQVKDKSVIDYIQCKLSKNEGFSVDELIEEYEAEKSNKAFQPMKNELFQNIKNQLIKILKNTEKIKHLTKLDERELGREVMNILQGSDSNLNR